MLSCVLQLLVMRMFFTLISKLHSSSYLSATFKSNVDCFTAGPSDVGAACTGLALLTSLFASHMAMMAVLVASIPASIIACVIFCSAAILYCLP